MTKDPFEIGRAILITGGVALLTLSVFGSAPVWALLGVIPLIGGLCAPALRAFIRSFSRSLRPVRARVRMSSRQRPMRRD